MLNFNGLASWLTSKFGPFFVNVTTPEEAYVPARIAVPGDDGGQEPGSTEIKRPGPKGGFGEERLNLRLAEDHLHRLAAQPRCL